MLSPYVRNYILSQAQAKVLSQTQGLYPAPLRILDVCIEYFHYKRKKTHFFTNRSFDKHSIMVRMLNLMLKLK